MAEPSIGPPHSWPLANLELLPDFLLVDIECIGDGNEGLSKELLDSLLPSLVGQLR